MTPLYRLRAGPSRNFYSFLDRLVLGFPPTSVSYPVGNGAERERVTKGSRTLSGLEMGQESFSRVDATRMIRRVVLRLLKREASCRRAIDTKRLNFAATDEYRGMRHLSLARSRRTPTCTSIT